MVIIMEKWNIWKYGWEYSGREFSGWEFSSARFSRGEFDWWEFSWWEFSRGIFLIPYDEIWKFDESIKNLEILFAKNSVEEEIELIEATNDKQSKSRIRIQARFSYARRLWNL